MPLPTKPNNPNIPIPNQPFTYPESFYTKGPWFNIEFGSGIDLTVQGIPTLTNNPTQVLAAGAGITLTTVDGITTITATGGGGGSGTVTSITASTGLTGGTITTSGTIALANTAVTPGAYTSANITVDAQGRITAAANGSGGGSGTVTSITAGTGLSGGTITTSGTVALANTAVTAGAYTYGAFTVDAQGRLTAASSGTAPVTNVTGTAPITSTGGATPAIGLADTAVTPGAYTYASLTVDAQGRLTAAGNGATPVIVNDFNAKGDLLVGTADNAFTALGVGADTFVLTADAACASGVKWAAGGGGGSAIPCSCITAKGDLITGTAASTPTTLTVGTDGQVLLACSTATNGICWGTGTVAKACPGTLGTVYGYVGTSIKADSSIGLGFCSMAAAVNLVTNSALGVQSLCSLTGGSANVAVGWRAMSATTDGCGNTAVGANAGGGAQGNSNVFIGNVAGCTQTSGDSNVAIGPNTVLASTTGSCQLAIGFSATDYWITGTSTKAIQPGAGIIDCAASTGTAGQVLMSNGSNAICWGAAGGASAATPTVAGIVLGCTTSANTSLGCNAFLLLTTGTSNTAVGNNALVNNTSGCRNTAFGIAALSNTTTGCYNTAFGPDAGNSITTGSNNVAIGRNAAVASATGSCQLAIGFSGTDNWLTGDSTKAIKPGAGIIDCASSTGTAGQVLMSNGSNAICWGAAGGASDATPTVAGIIKGCTTATNSALGCNALLVTTGASNSAFGNNALCANTTGIYNTAMGESALFFNTTGSYNTAVGPFALGRTSTGLNNTATGHYAMRCNQTGNDNTAAGYYSLRCNTNGCFNTAIGSLALRRNTAGDSNTAIGNRALYLSTGGIGNTAIGSYALCNITTGCANVMVGGTNSTAGYAPVFDPTTENNRVVIGSTATTNAYVQVAWTVVSDARDKTNVTALPVGLDFVNQLNPVSFQFKESRECDTATGPVRYGFLAQEVLAAEGENPVIVDTEVPDHLKVTNDHFNAVLVKAIQELSAKVDSLERKLATNG